MEGFKEIDFPSKANFHWRGSNGVTTSLLQTATAFVGSGGKLDGNVYYGVFHFVHFREVVDEFVAD